MPAWQPNWENVRWDHGAAQDAIRALNNAANRLEQTASERERLARDATAQWRGRYRQEFDVHLQNMLRRARTLAEEYRHAARQIARASAAALEEQRRRERERERWRQEKEAEERALWLKQQGGL